MHDLADALDADLGILGLAVPQTPAQPVGFRDDHRLRLLPRRRIGRQGAGGLLQVLQPHCDMEPIQDRRRGDTGGGQDRPQTSAPVGEAGQHRGPGSAEAVECAADQGHEIRL